MEKQSQASPGLHEFPGWWIERRFGWGVPLEQRRRYTRYQSFPQSENNNNNIDQNVTAKSLEDIERQVAIESALSANLERTMTVLYPTYLDLIGRIAMMRRRCDLEKDWSVATAQELEALKKEGNRGTGEPGTGKAKAA